MGDYGNRFLHILFPVIVIPRRERKAAIGGRKGIDLEFSSVFAFRFLVFERLPDAATIVTPEACHLALWSFLCTTSLRTRTRRVGGSCANWRRLVFAAFRCS